MVFGRASRGLDHEKSRKASKAQLHEPRREGGRERSRETGGQGKKDKEKDRKKDIDKEKTGFKQYLKNIWRITQGNLRNS